MSDSERRFLLRLLAALIIGSLHGFQFPTPVGPRSAPPKNCLLGPTTPRHHHSASSRLRQSWRSEPPPDYAKFSYSDDCFGLISLSTGIAAKDATFAMVFVGISALTAVASATVLSEMLTAKDERKVPGAVAGATLIVAPLVARVLPVLGIEGPGSESAATWAPVLEVGVCTFSLIYGFLLSSAPAADD